MTNKFALEFGESRSDNNYTIYPFAVYNDSHFGSINISETKWNQIYNKMVTRRHTKITSTNYVLRDMICSVVRDKKTVKILDIYDAYVSGNCVVRIGRHRDVDLEQFPVLNKYDDEYDLTQYIYNFGLVKLYLNHANGLYSIEISFAVTSITPIDTLNSDLNTVYAVLFE